MKCPCCNSEMEKGVIQSAREVFFTPIPKKGWFVPRGNEDVSLSSHNFTGPTCVGYICRDCKKAVVDYAVKPE